MHPYLYTRKWPLSGSPEVVNVCERVNRYVTSICLENENEQRIKGQCKKNTKFIITPVGLDIQQIHLPDNTEQISSNLIHM